MGGSVEVVVSELDSAAGRVADAGQRLQDGLSAVDLSVEELLGKGWKGGAATAYTAEWDKWHSGAGQIVRALQVMSESLEAAGSHYAATDQQAAAAVDSSFQPTGGAPEGAPAGSPAGPAGPGAGSAPLDQSARGGAPSGQGGSGAMAEMMNLGQPAAQAGQALGQATGQLAAGLAQAAAGIAQAVTALAQQAAQAAEKDDPEKDDDERIDGATEQAREAEEAADRVSSRAPVDAPQPTPTTGVPTGASRPSSAG
ncbi:WXG100 family type VII secretion target [Mycobacterium sp. NPDC050551]|uniref:WXG100 family type VII secretion target n=1 Tax=Mycobacterium sp. NPDC050551 TaxID=3155407 RepID=UPI0034155D0A